jgi:two-component system sensor histidine kinase UhpB
VSLRLRLNLIITGLLLLVMLAGAVLTINSARSNVRAEVASAEKLALYLFETGVLNNPALAHAKQQDKIFGLQSLQHMRHLKIQFFDPSGKLLDSNQSEPQTKQKNTVPSWFEAIMDSVTPTWEPKRLPVEHDQQHWGDIIITPDPTYEYSEVWNQITGVLVLVAIFFVAVNAMVYWAVALALSPVERILEALNQLEQGNLKARLPQFALKELARIIEKFNHMVETLEHSILQNHRLSQQLISLLEEERKSLARDLHDEFGQ